ncbi:hypothetical protein BGZ50_005067, partial [Haplosporangium sp. Z 11]
DKLSEDQMVLSAVVGQTTMARVPSVSDYVASVVGDAYPSVLAKDEQDRPSDSSSRSRFSVRERTRGKGGWGMETGGSDCLI